MIGTYQHVFMKHIQAINSSLRPAARSGLVFGDQKFADENCLFPLIETVINIIIAIFS